MKVQALKLNEGKTIEVKKKPIRKVPNLNKAERFIVNDKDGLTTEQVFDRFKKGFYNKSNSKVGKSYLQIVLTNIFTFFNLLGFLCAFLFFYTNTWQTKMIFFIVYSSNLIIGLVQEIRAKMVVEKINLLTSPLATVVRDGKVVDCKVVDIVLDDVVVLNLGRQVCADCTLISGSVEANESMLTGESIPVKKNPGDFLYAGSFIVSGKGHAKVEKIGDLNYSAGLVKKAQSQKKAKSELLDSINWIIKIIGFILVPLGTAVFLSKFFGAGETHGDLIKSLLITANNVALMIPAGMYLSISMALAVGIIKLARKGAIAQDAYSIEMLSRVDVLCLDKTGTITDGTMNVKKVIELENDDYSIESIIGSMISALQDNNQTSLALANHFGYSKELDPIEILPFSSSRKLSAVSFKDRDIGDVTYILGAPEFVCRKANASVTKLVKEFSEQGFRVLCLAKVKGKIAKDKLPTAEPTPVAIIVVEDHIRENAEATLKWFYENNVNIKIISGDNPITVSEIAKRVGVKNADKFINLEGLTKQQVVDSVSHYTVFGRVSPEQKAILVKALKNMGKKVAMTGDGVNDILALKESDCSIAMASGSEAARNVSKVVLLESDFAALPSIVAEGRRVVNNISKGSSLFLMKTFYVIFMTLFGLIWTLPNFFELNLFILLEMLIIGLPSLVIAMQPNNNPIQAGFLSNLITKAVPGAILYIIVTMLCYFFGKFTGLADDTIITMASLSVTFTGLFIVFRICKPFDLVRTLMFITASALIGASLIIKPIYAYLSYTQLEIVHILLIVILVQFSYNIYSFITKQSERWIAFLWKSRKG